MAWTHGDNLKAARIRLGLTQRAAADLIGVQTGAYGSWERGDHDPSLENLRAIVERLRVPPELVGYEPPQGWELVPSAWIRDRFDTIIGKLDELGRPA